MITNDFKPGFISPLTNDKKAGKIRQKDAGTEVCQVCKTSCEGSEASALLRCCTCHFQFHLECQGLVYPPVLSEKWQCWGCSQTQVKGGEMPSKVRRGQRKRNSRFTLVDGKVVLKLNRYGLEEGEPSVFDRELNSDEEDEDSEFSMPDDKEVSKIILEGLAYISKQSPRGGATLPELQVWTSHRLGASKLKGNERVLQKVAQKVVDLVGKKLCDQELTLLQGQLPLTAAAQLWPKHPILFSIIVHAIWARASSETLLSDPVQSSESSSSDNKDEKESTDEQSEEESSTQESDSDSEWSANEGKANKARANRQKKAKASLKKRGAQIHFSGIFATVSVEFGDSQQVEEAVKEVCCFLERHGFLEKTQKAKGGYIYSIPFVYKVSEPFVCQACGKQVPKEKSHLMKAHLKASEVCHRDKANAKLIEDLGSIYPQFVGTLFGKPKPATKNTAKEQNKMIQADTARMEEKQLVYLAHFREWLSPFILEEERALLKKVAKDHMLRDSERQGILKGYLAPSHAITEQPKQIVGGEMRSYQLEGLSWMVYLFNQGLPVILGDEMGLGKTLQTIAFIAYLKFNLNVSGPHLVICPLTVLSSWLSECKRWCPALNVIRVHSSSSGERKRLQKEIQDNLKSYDIVITTYEMVLDMRNTAVWRSVILDEGHKIKNEETRIAKKMRLVRSQFKMILTGTPLQNTLRELWSLLNYLLPAIFKSDKVFDQAFNLSKTVVDANILTKAHYCLKPFLLRRLKVEVEYKLPLKKVIDVKLPLTEYQKFWYKAFIVKNSQMLRRLERNLYDEGVLDAEKEEGDWRKLNSLMAQLRKISNHPYCIKDADPNPTDITEDLVQHSTKMELLDRLLPKLKAKGHRVVIFSAFTMMLDILEDFFGMRGYRYFRIDGSTSRVQRTVNVGQFQTEGDRTFLFMMTTRSGGLGITLTKADTVILYDSDWNPQVDLQAMDRVHRIGQTKPVHVYRLVTAGTIEERMVLRSQQKLYLDQMVNRGSTQMADDLEKLDTKELLKTLKFGCNAIIETGSQKKVTDAEIDKMIDRTINADAKVEKDELKDAADFDVHQEPLALRIFEGEDFSEIPLTSMKSIAESYRLKMKNKKRTRTERFMEIDGHTVLKMNNYTLEDGEPTVFEKECNRKYAGKEPKKATKQMAGRDYQNEDHCQNCWDGGDLVCCDGCPASYHPGCLGLEAPPESNFGRWFCPRHKCHLCWRGPSEVGGLLFVCMGCPISYCDDCLVHGVKIMGRCRRYERLGCLQSSQACYIFCSKECSDFIDEKFPQYREVDSDSEDESAGKSLVKRIEDEPAPVSLASGAQDMLPLPQSVASIAMMVEARTSSNEKIDQEKQAKLDQPTISSFFRETVKDEASTKTMQAKQNMQQVKKNWHMSKHRGTARKENERPPNAAGCAEMLKNNGINQNGDKRKHSFPFPYAKARNEHSLTGIHPNKRLKQEQNILRVTSKTTARPKKYYSSDSEDEDKSLSEKVNANTKTCLMNKIGINSMIWVDGAEERPAGALQSNAPRIGSHDVVDLVDSSDSDEAMNKSNRLAVDKL